MTTREDDRDLRAAFEALRDDECRGAPAFGPLLAPPSPRRGARMRWVFATAATVTSAAILALMLYVPRVPGGATLEESIAMAEAISSWTAPSDEFATLSGGGIREGLPNLAVTSLTLPEWPAVDAGESN